MDIETLHRRRGGSERTGCFVFRLDLKIMCKECCPKPPKERLSGYMAKNEQRSGIEFKKRRRGAVYLI